MKLYEINDRIAALVAENGERDMPEDIAAALDGLEMEFDDKIDNIGRLLRQLDGEADMLANEAVLFSQRAKVKRNQMERLKEYVAQELKRKGVTKAGKTIRLSLQKTAPSLKVIDKLQVKLQAEQVLGFTDGPNDSVIETDGAGKVYETFEGPWRLTAELMSKKAQAEGLPPGTAMLNGECVRVTPL